jgi:hypothetical protein
MAVNRHRVFELSGVVLIGLGCFAAGRLSRPEPAAPRGPPAPLMAAPRAPEAPAATPETDAARPEDYRQPEDPRQPEPRAVAARAGVIRRDAAAIESECRRAAGGDWDKWQRDTAHYRLCLRKMVEALKDLDGNRPPYAECRQQPLEGRDGFPLFETGPREYLSYLYEPTRVEAFRRGRAVVAADRWLRQRGIDLIFVSVPKMTEVYAEHFVDPCPPDGVIAPHVRHALYELLESDVEVVDGWSLFRPLREPDPEYLYNAAEPHWAPRGWRVMAKELAGRIERYRFGARARYRQPLFRTSTVKNLVSVGHFAGLSPEQQARAEAAQTRTFSEVFGKDGRKPADDPKSPVLVIGHSFVTGFREQLIKELNLPVNERVSDGMTTEAFGDFLREPELLAHTRVVVWVTTEQHFTRFKPLPEPVMQALAAAPIPPDTSPAPARPASP